jgi:hypothetical protein
MWKPCLCVTLGLVTLAGCAADRISTPAKAIGTDVATFQGSLSTFQDNLKREQDDERGTIAGTSARRDLAVAAARQMQVEWMIANAKSGTDVFVLLQSEGRNEVTPLLAPATPAALPASISFPVDQLGGVAKTMDQLSRGQSTEAEVEFLVNYGIAVNQQLKTIEDQAKAKLQTAPPASAMEKTLTETDHE